MAREIQKPGFERRDGRGVFLEISNGFPARTVLSGSMKRGAVLGNHYHKRTRVFFFLTGGSAAVAIENVQTGEREDLELSESRGVFFEVNESHTVRFLEDGDFVMLKSLPYDPADPDTYAHPLEQP